MYKEAKSGRDAFTFSRHGLTAKVPFGPMPMMDGQSLNRRISPVSPEETPNDQPDTAREYEGFLAKFFAPRRGKAA